MNVSRADHVPRADHAIGDVMSRRAVLQGAGALIVSFTLSPALAQEGGPTNAAAGRKLPGSLSRTPLLDAWIRIDPDGSATAFTGKAELGQGIKTCLLQIAAEELELPVSRVKLITADTALTPNEGYTAGSHSTQDSGTALRNAAAQVRELLIGEAARRWSLPPDNLKATDGTVVAPGGKRLGYGELVSATLLHVDAQPTSKLKAPTTLTVLGKSLPRVDIPPKVTGGAIYVQDLRLPGMLHARVVRPPSYGAQLVAIDTSPIERMPGVVKIIRDRNFLAVVAAREYQSIKAMQALAAAAKWDEKPTLPKQSNLYSTLLSLPTEDYTILAKPPAALTAPPVAQSHTAAPQPSTAPVAQSHTAPPQPSTARVAQSHTAAPQPSTAPVARSHTAAPQPSTAPVARSHAAAPQPSTAPVAQSHTAAPQPSTAPVAQSHTAAPQPSTAPVAHSHAAAPQPSTAPVGTPASDTTSLAATYTRPYLAHASIGPSCAVAHLQGDTLTVWTHTQGVYPDRQAISEMLRMPPDKVHCIHMQGSGCYGHNGADDAAADAALIATHLPGRPIRVQWMRDQEFTWEPYGPAMIAKVHASLDATGQITDWDYGVWSNTHSMRPGPAGSLLAAQHSSAAFSPPPPKPLPQPEGGGDRNAIPLYNLPRAKVIHHFIPDMPLRISALRSLGAYMNVFAVESFMDELAAAAHADPVAFRLKHLDDPRARDVITTAASRFGWTNRSQGGHGTGCGFAFARYKNLAAYCAVAVQLNVDHDSGRVQVERIVAAIDTGQIVNPDGIRNQVEGGILQSMSWTLYESVNFDDAQIRSVDWSTYPIMRFDAVPHALEVHLIDRPGQPFLGCGEASQGPASAAFANALAAATGKRLRDLPLTAARIKQTNRT